MHAAAAQLTAAKQNFYDAVREQPSIRPWVLPSRTEGSVPFACGGLRSRAANQPIGQAAMTTSTLDAIPVIIVTFRNAADAEHCLRALARLETTPRHAVYLCENGGSAAFDRLVATLTGPDGPCEPDSSPPALAGRRFVRTIRLRLLTSDPSQPVSVHVGEAVDNLGYAGGVNSWLEPLLAVAGWPAAWILNPDTEPAADALKELAKYAASHGRGMVGSQLRPHFSPDIVHCRGLAWRKWRAATLAVDFRTPASVCPPPDDVDRRLDAPSGASCYVTRDCIEHIGLMDERYFLYFEDLDWGLRAKKCCGVGYAHGSVVNHVGGTTVGTSGSRRTQSPLSVYLDFRNRILFVRSNFIRWLPWTVFAQFAEVAEFARIRAFRNMSAAIHGTIAGLMGQTGRPDNILFAHFDAARTEKS